MEEGNATKSYGVGNITSSDTDVENMVTAWFQIISGCLGFVGNLICLVVLGRRSRKDHTNWLIINQCVADLVTSVLLVVATVDQTWFRTTSFSSMSPLKCELLCRLWYSQVVVFTGFAISTFNLTMISLERYLAVIHPIVYLASFKRHSTFLLTVFAWLTAPLMQVILASALYKYHGGHCVYVGQRPGFGIGVFVWEFLLPVSVMTYAYVKIALKLHSLGRVSAVWARDGPSVRVNAVQGGTLSVGKKILESNASTSPGDLNLKEVPPLPQAPVNICRHKTTITLFIVYLTYMVCWTPNQVAFLVFNLGGIPDYFGNKWHAISTILASFNICANPIIYAFRYSPFRKEFRQILNEFTCSRL